MRTRPIRHALQALALAGVASLLALLVWKLTHDPGGGVAAQLSQGKRPAAPNFTLPRLDGDGTVELAAIKKPRVVDFFASWCYACPYESKRLEKYSRQYANKIVREQGRKVLNTWGGLPIPRVFFIDRNGKVIGQMQAEEDLPRFLKQLAANKA